MGYSDSYSKVLQRNNYIFTIILRLKFDKDPQRKFYLRHTNSHAHFQTWVLIIRFEHSNRAFNDTDVLEIYIYIYIHEIEEWSDFFPSKLTTPFSRKLFQFR